MLSIYPLLWRLCLSSCQISFQRNYSTCNCIFVVSVRGSEFRISLHCHRESSYPNNFNKAFVQTIDFFLTGIFQKKIVYLFSYIYIYMLSQTLQWTKLWIPLSLFTLIVTLLEWILRSEVSPIQRLFGSYYWNTTQNLEFISIWNP